jgi:hypothetical protein
MIYIASYKKPNGGFLPWLFHILVCIGTFSRYSHNELVFGPPDAKGRRCCWSSSDRDGGVRMKWIALDPSRWDLVPLSGVHPDVIAAGYQWFSQNEGKPFDRPGLVAVWLFTLMPWLRVVWAHIQRDRAYFCSEAIAAALGLWRPWTRSPGALHSWAVKHQPKIS